ncbi:retrovirus-related pol polyprotein from transposon TNT 1-94 [Tanacetum coccineum]
MLAPTCPTFNGRPTFANPMYLKKAQYEKPCLYVIPHDQSDHVNRLVPDREETLTRKEESRSKLNKDLVKPFDYTKLNKIVDQAWVKHSNDRLHLRNPTAQDMEILVKTCLMPLALKTQNDSFAFVHELKQEMHASPAIQFKIVQLILFNVDSGCTKHMMGNLSLLCNFVEKYLGTVHFGNDQFALILGYGDLVQGNITINRGNDLRTGNRGTDLYTIYLQETTSSTPICLMAKASPTQAWLWHRRLSHLNFDYINLLSKKDVVIGLPKLKYVKDQLCSSCEVSKAKQSSFKSKTVPSSKGRNLQAPVIFVRTDRGTEFLNKTLNAFFIKEGIKHQTSTPQTPEQNGIIERRNRTLVEAARTMLSASKLPLFFWAEAIATACYTKNRSIIIPTHEKMAYHIINDRKPSIKHLYIFGCTCYLTRDGENLDKIKEKGDPCILVGYSTQSKGYRVYNKRTRLIVESIHLRFDEIKEMSETSVANDTSGLVPQQQKALDYVNPDPAPELQNVSPSADTTIPSQQELDLLFGPLYDEFFNDGTSHVNKSSSPTDNSTKKTHYLQRIFDLHHNSQL